MKICVKFKIFFKLKKVCETLNVYSNYTITGSVNAGNNILYSKTITGVYTKQCQAILFGASNICCDLVMKTDENNLPVSICIECKLGLSVVNLLQFKLSCVNFK